MPNKSSKHAATKKPVRRYAVAGLTALGLVLVSLALFNPHATADTGTGSVSLTTMGAAVSENFDTLSNTAGSTTNTTLPTGWYITEQGGGARDNEQYAVDTGSSTTGDIYSYGAAGSIDRALGALRSGTLIPFFGAKFTNNTGATITSLDISYTGEEWRLGTAARQDRIDFQISTDATDLTTGTYTDVNTLDFSTPDTVTVGAKNGNAAPDRTAIAATISSLNIPNGATFFIRWTDFDATGADDGLAVDNFSLTPNTGAVTPTLNINDVTQAETNAGTTTFTFTVSLTSPATGGGVTFDVATADGTAQDGNPVGEDNDYVAKTELGRTIAAGNSSAVFTVTVNGDTTPEPNETFFVNVTNISGANPGDTQGLGTISNDDVTLTPIHSIQGAGNTSPLTGNTVSTSGIVTGVRSNGFFIEEPDATVDADPSTSEGVFVFTSSAPAAAAAVGNLVQVTATISEFIPSADTFSPSQTEMVSPSVVLLSTGNPLPTPITISAGATLVNDYNNLEKFEGMRVQVPSLTAISGTQGNLNESTATSVSNGVFYGVVTGVPRPFREPGIELPDPVPTPYPAGTAPANVPRFDFNPERLRINTAALVGSTILDVVSGQTITNIVGPLDYGFRTYTIDTEPATVPSVSGNSNAVPVPTPTSNELTIASFNLERFFDTTDDPNTSDAVLTATAFNNRLNKASLAIRNVLQTPDVIGVEEMENLTTLQALATKINNDAVAASQPNPGYQAYLIEGNDIGGIDVGFLVKSARINFVSVTQDGKNTIWNSPTEGANAALNDRPPLILRATIQQPDASILPFTVVAVHQRSLSGVDASNNSGAHVRLKRKTQAEYLAQLLDELQHGGPRQVLPYDQQIVCLGDFNSFESNDGYADVMGTVLGSPAPADQVVEPSTTITTNMFDLLPLAAPGQNYSYSFDGDAQTLDHELVSRSMLARFSRIAYGRMDADYPEAFRNDPNRPERLSDHDPGVAYFNLTLSPTAANGSISGRILDANGAPLEGAAIDLTGSQTRKTITDGSGRYLFDNVETNGFYSVRPSRANFDFNPAQRSFSQLGNKTEAAFMGVSRGDITNPLDVAEYFVRQQYLDLLGREPDEAGFGYWSDQITQCGNDVLCTSARRREVAAAFFIEQEAQQTVSYIHDLYKAALGRRPSFNEYSADRRQVVGGLNLEAQKLAFAGSFVARAEFVEKYQACATAESFVAALIQNTRNVSGADLDNQRAALISRYNAGTSQNQSRAFVVHDLSENASLRNAEYNNAFVLAEYFAYLQRDPDPDGYAFWTNVLNNGDVGNYRGMVCAFTTAAEYQRRFSRIISRSDSECVR